MAQAAARTANTPVLARLMNLLSPPDARDRSGVGSDEVSAPLGGPRLPIAGALSLRCAPCNRQRPALARTGERHTPEWVMAGSSDQPVILRPPDRFGPVVGVQLAVGAARVLLDGVGRKRKIGRDLVVGLAARDRREHLFLAHGQARDVARELRRRETEAEAGESYGGDDLLDAPGLRDEAAC